MHRVMNGTPRILPALTDFTSKTSLQTLALRSLSDVAKRKPCRCTKYCLKFSGGLLGQDFDPRQLCQLQLKEKADQVGSNAIGQSPQNRGKGTDSVTCRK